MGLQSRRTEDTFEIKSLRPHSQVVWAACGYIPEIHPALHCHKEWCFDLPTKVFILLFSSSTLPFRSIQNSLVDWCLPQVKKNNNNKAFGPHRWKCSCLLTYRAEDWDLITSGPWWHMEKHVNAEVETQAWSCSLVIRSIRVVFKTRWEQGHRWGPTQSPKKKIQYRPPQPTWFYIFGINFCLEPLLLGNPE